MQDNKLKVLLWIGAIWAALFLTTMRVKTPVMEGVTSMVLFVGLLWLAYWSISIAHATFNKKPPEEEKKDKTSETMGKE